MRRASRGRPARGCPPGRSIACAPTTVCGTPIRRTRSETFSKSWRPGRLPNVSNRRLQRGRNVTRASQRAIMSNHKTFIGAYARNRRGGQASDAPSNRGAGVNDVPPLPSQPHTTPAVPPHHFSAIAETTPEPLPCPTDSSAELPTDALSHSVVVSSTYPDADGLWLGDDQDRILRIDAAAT